MSYSGQVFAKEIADAMAAPTQAAQRSRTEEAVQKALASPTLLDDWAELAANHLEFHLLRTPRAAIKVFMMKPEHPKGPPHDHGGFWGCYATYSGYLHMDFYQTLPDQPEAVKMAKESAVLEGQWRFVEPDAIHQVWVAVPSIILTIYNGDLNSVPRRIFDTRNSRLLTARSDWEDRLQAGGGSSYQL